MSALRTPDPDAAPAFYGAVFGWQAEPFGPATMWRLPGYVGGEPQQPVPRDVVAAMEPAQPDAAPEWAVDFCVADADTTARTAAARGGAGVVVAVPPCRRHVREPSTITARSKYGEALASVHDDARRCR